MRRSFLTCAFIALIVSAYSFGSIELGFYNITNNNPGDAAIGEAQLSVEVIETGSDVTFLFKNSGPEASVIAEIYFDDGSLLGFASIDESLPLVDFDEQDVGSVSPPDLPGGNSITPQFNATGMFSIEPDNPQPKWGVEPAEWVSLTYTLQNNQTYDDVLDELSTGELRIGMHVIAFDSEGSESFVNKTYNEVPEPATLMLLAAGGLFSLIRRK